jgi:hypothetical protein
MEEKQRRAVACAGQVKLHPVHQCSPVNYPLDGRKVHIRVSTTTGQYVP